ncbi:hypothetical protein PV05_11807 [Exophiala xenobiotica]|uniref:Isochorismatase-like domain-containing protein n=1 Tax=Exophiala xenobiotica TaxID=348802 RepID=A0A0D2EQZ7_9EURO|nr:uncharacterized protein PV05_11807 [Exophiala xenobiotica]KIW50194.1 hypothetical protein PV05_11807 [Exophiala xenobiotica]
MVGVVKLVTGAMVGILGLVATWWALDLAMWTAAKDFREDCREQFQAFNVTSPECDKILRQSLRPPPTWRDYFKTNIPKVQYYRVHGSPSHDELGASEPIATQYGDTVMCDTSTLIFNFPLDEAVCEERWAFSATIEENCACHVWTNGTAVGTVEVADVYVPHFSGPEQCEELGSLMQLADQELWRLECVYPWTAAQPSPSPSRLEVGGTAGIPVEIVEAFGIAFLLASFAKGLFRWDRPHAVVADRGPGAKKGEKGKSMSYVAARAVFSPTDSTSPLSVSPSETALLLIDYQNIAVARLGDAAPSVLGIARQMRDWALCKGMSVYHCLIDTRPGITQPPARNKIAAKWRMYEDKFAAVPGLGFEADVLAPVDPGWEKTVLRTPGLISALESRGLMDELVSRGVKSLMVCGIVTSGCVLSTARAATDQGFIVTVVEDACFDPVPGLHGMLCAHALPMTAHVATAGEIRDAWKVL